MGQKRKLWALICAKAVLAAGIVWYLALTGAVDWSMLQSLGEHQTAVGGVIAICMLMYAISIVRWQMLLSCQDIHLATRDAGNVTLFSLFLNCFLPGGGFGGDAYRITYVACRFPGRRTAGVLSVFVDRGLGFYALVVVVTLASLAHLKLVAANPVLLSLAAASWLVMVGVPILAVMARFCTPRTEGTRDGDVSALATGLRRTMEAAIRSSLLYMKAPATMLAALGMSLVIQLLAIVAVIILGYTMGFLNMSVMDYAFATPWGWLASLFPLTLGGLGVGEAAFDQVCRWLKVGDSAIGYATILLGYRALAMTATLPGLVLWLLSAESWKTFVQANEAVE